ncbi:MAG: hypothetical protein JKX84_09490 [Flavobacteriales bacterium]|nr:hypothetical protein [Flavobacteriales bacterium]
MKSLPLQPEDLIRYQRSIDLLKEVVHQINKDFQLNGLDVEFSGEGETAYTELTDQIKPVVEYLSEKQPDRFWNLLYSIDISEAKVKEALFGSEPDSIGLLTNLILKRELQKVVIRHFYSGKQLP